MHKAWHRTSALKFGHLKLDNCVQALTHKNPANQFTKLNQ